MSERNLIEEVEARLRYVPRWRLILGVVLLIPPFSVLGMAILTYELLRAGEPLRAAEDEALTAVEAAETAESAGTDDTTDADASDEE